MTDTVPPTAFDRARAAALLRAEAYLLDHPDMRIRPDETEFPELYHDMQRDKAETLRAVATHLAATETPEWTLADRQHLAHLSECKDPSWMGEVATRAAQYIARLESRAATETPAEPDAEDLLSYLDDCASGGVNVHFVHSRDHDGVREEMRPDGLWIWVNSAFGDPDRSGYVGGENISDALRDSLASQPASPSRLASSGSDPRTTEARYKRELYEGKRILDAAMTAHPERQADPLYQAIEQAFRALPNVGEPMIAFGAAPPAAASEPSEEAPASTDERQCLAMFPGYPYFCTRPSGHGGYHVAHCVRDRVPQASDVLERWAPIDPATPETRDGD